MIRKRETGQWLIFYEDNATILDAHFQNGGTVEMLNGDVGPISLYHCCNEYAIDCLPIMMKNGAIPDKETWKLAFKVSRDEWVRSFIEFGFWPTRSIALCDYGNSWHCRDEVTKSLCRIAVLSILSIGKLTKQPFSDLWKIIAREIRLTKYNKNWLNCLKN